MWYHKGDAFGFTCNGEEYYYIKNVNMSSEWLFHNIAYELHLKRKSTADADIEHIGDCRPYVYIPTKVLKILGSE